MKSETAHALIKRLIQRVETRSGDDAASERVENAEVFLCPQRFAREKQQFFFDTPQVIGFAGEIQAPGSYLATEVMGIPVLLTRDELGTLRAFINACAHKGAKVADGRGARLKLTCKFHGWTYGLDGSLSGRPQEACFASDRESRGLQPLPVSERSGLIVLGLKPEMPQSLVDSHLQDIENEFSGFEFSKMHYLETRRFEVKANWKLIAGLSYESYHFATLHRDSVAALLQPNYIADFFGPPGLEKHSRWCFPLIGIEKLKHKSESEWPRFVPGAVSHAVFPGTVVIAGPEDAQMIRTEPGVTPDTSIVYYSGVCRHADKQKSSLEVYDFGGKAFENEDLPAAIECQQGLQSARKDFPIGRNEPVVQFWHRLWRERLKE
jgi:phenylpropionate dioxygenase-like ring-hydroxylating dioxygenase large terminal subunit